MSQRRGSGGWTPLSLQKVKEHNVRSHENRSVRTYDVTTSSSDVTMKQASRSSQQQVVTQVPPAAPPQMAPPMAIQQQPVVTQLPPKAPTTQVVEQVGAQVGRESRLERRRRRVASYKNNQGQTVVVRHSSLPGDVTINMADAQGSARSLERQSSYGGRQVQGQVLAETQDFAYTRNRSSDNIYSDDYGAVTSLPADMHALPVEAASMEASWYSGQIPSDKTKVMTFSTNTTAQKEARREAQEMRMQAGYDVMSESYAAACRRSRSRETLEFTDNGYDVRARPPEEVNSAYDNIMMNMKGGMATKQTTKSQAVAESVTSSRQMTTQSQTVKSSSSSREASRQAATRYIQFAPEAPKTVEPPAVVDPGAVTQFGDLDPGAVTQFGDLDPGVSQFSGFSNPEAMEKLYAEFSDITGHDAMVPDQQHYSLENTAAAPLEFAPYKGIEQPSVARPMDPAHPATTAQLSTGLSDVTSADVMTRSAGSSEFLTSYAREDSRSMTSSAVTEQHGAIQYGAPVAMVTEQTPQKPEDTDDSHYFLHGKKGTERDEVDKVIAPYLFGPQDGVTATKALSPVLEEPRSDKVTEAASGSSMLASATSAQAAVKSTSAEFTEKKMMTSSTEQKMTSSTEQKMTSSTEQKMTSSTEQKMTSSTEQKMTSSTEQKMMSLSEQKMASSTEQKAMQQNAEMKAFAGERSVINSSVQAEQQQQHAASSVFQSNTTSTQQHQEVSSQSMVQSTSVSKQVSHQSVMKATTSAQNHASSQQSMLNTSSSAEEQVSNRTAMSTSTESSAEKRVSKQEVMSAVHTTAGGSETRVSNKDLMRATFAELANGSEVKSITQHDIVEHKKAAAQEQSAVVVVSEPVVAREKPTPAPAVSTSHNQLQAVQQSVTTAAREEKQVSRSDVHVTGQAEIQQSAVKVTGEAASFQQSEFKVTGQAASVKQSELKVTGQAAVQRSEFEVTGQAASVQQGELKVTGLPAAQQSEVKVIGPAAFQEGEVKVTGQAVVQKQVREAKDTTTAVEEVILVKEESFRARPPPPPPPQIDNQVTSRVDKPSVLSEQKKTESHMKPNVSEAPAVQEAMIEELKVTKGQTSDQFKVIETMEQKLTQGVDSSGVGKRTATGSQQLVEKPTELRIVESTEDIRIAQDKLTSNQVAEETKVKEPQAKVVQEKPKESETKVGEKADVVKAKVGEPKVQGTETKGKVGDLKPQVHIGAETAVEDETKIETTSQQQRNVDKHETVVQETSIRQHGEEVQVKAAERPKMPPKVPPRTPDTTQKAKSVTEQKMQAASTITQQAIKTKEVADTTVTPTPVQQSKVEVKSVMAQQEKENSESQTISVSSNQEVHVKALTEVQQVTTTEAKILQDKRDAITLSKQATGVHLESSATQSKVAGHDDVVKVTPGALATKEETKVKDVPAHVTQVQTAKVTKEAGQIQQAATEAITNEASSTVVDSKASLKQQPLQETKVEMKVSQNETKAKVKTTQQVQQVVKTTEETSTASKNVAKKDDTNKVALEEIKIQVEDLKTKVDTAKSKVEETKPKVEETKPKVEETKPKVEETKPKIKETKLKVEETRPKVEETKPKVDEAKPKIGEIKAKVDEPKAIVPEPQAKIEESKAKVEPKAKIEEPKAKLEEVITKVEEPKAKVEEPKAKLHEAKTKVEEPKSKVEETKAKVEETKTKVPFGRRKSQQDDAKTKGPAGLSKFGQQKPKTTPEPKEAPGPFKLKTTKVGAKKMQEEQRETVELKGFQLKGKEAAAKKGDINLKPVEKRHSISGSKASESGFKTITATSMFDRKDTIVIEEETVSKGASEKSFPIIEEFFEAVVDLSGKKKPVVKHIKTRRSRSVCLPGRGSKGTGRNGRDLDLKDRAER